MYKAGKRKAARFMLERGVFLERSGVLLPWGTPILVDCGDELQGNPLCYIHHRLHQEMNEPSVAIMNALGYHAMVVGECEFDFGMKTLRSAEKQARFPWLAANAVSASTGDSAFTPYVKVEVSGLQVLVVGFTAPAVSSFMEPARYGSLALLDVVETAKALIPRLRAQEKPDMLMVAIHGEPGKPGVGAMKDENPVLRLAEQVPGIDLILVGHGQGALPMRHKGVAILQPAFRGQALGAADLSLRKENGEWKLLSCETSLVQAKAETAQDLEVLELSGSIRARTDSYLNTYATDLKVDLDGRWTRMESSPLMRLLHDTLREATGAQVTAIRSPGSKLFVPKGPTSIRQFWALFPHEAGRPAPAQNQCRRLPRSIPKKGHSSPS